MERQFELNWRRVIHGQANGTITRAFFVVVTGGLVAVVLEETFSAECLPFVSSTCSARGVVSSVLSAAVPEVETGCGESVSSRGDKTSSSS